MKNLMILIPLLLLIVSCVEKEESPIIHQHQTSEPLCEALIDFDDVAVATIIDELVVDLEPNPVASDVYGHQKNLKVLIKSLEDISCIKVSSDCYACLESFPPLTSIHMEVTGDNNESFIRRIYLRTSAEEKLSFNALH